MAGKLRRLPGEPSRPAALAIHGAYSLYPDGDLVKSLIAFLLTVAAAAQPLPGHQPWARTTFGPLRRHSEFGEAPGKYPTNQGIATFREPYRELRKQ